ncbi:MAG: hypothetical protein ACI9EF_003249, partial [Pseudohongiellaceae bacterium]
MTKQQAENMGPGDASTDASTHGLKSRGIGPWSAGVLLAGLSLGLAELVWLWALDFAIEGQHVLLTLALAVVLVCLCELVVGGLASGLRRLAGHR